MTKPAPTLYTFASLSLVIIIDALVMGIIFPLMGALFLDPQHAIVPTTTSTHLRDFYYSLTMGIFFFCSIIGAPFFGDLSDIFGRRKTLLISLFITGLSCIASAAAIGMKSIWLFIFARAVGGFTAGNQALAQAAIIDISTPETKARNISLITLAACVGFVIGPMVGGFFANSRMFNMANFSTPFFIAALFAFLNALCLLLSFRETFYPNEERKLQWSRGLTLLYQGFTQKKLRQWLLVFLCIQLGWGAYFQWISLLLAQVNHYTPNQIGLFMAAVGLVFAISLSTIVPFCVKRYSLKLLLVYGLVLSTVGILVNGLWVSSLFVHWISILGVALGEALSYTCLMTLISNTVGNEEQGFVMGTSAAVGSFAWGTAAFGVGLFGGINMRLPFLIGALILVGSFFMIKTKEKA